LYATLEDANNQVRIEWEEWEKGKFFDEITRSFGDVEWWWGAEDHGGRRRLEVTTRIMRKSKRTAQKR